MISFFSPSENTFRVDPNAWSRSTFLGALDENGGSNALLDQTKIVYEFARFRQIEGWWLWAVMLAGLALAVFLCLRCYRRDVATLSRPIRWTLMSLRLLVVLGLVFFFFNLQRRTERLVTRPSEVVVLVDTSQSMALPFSSEPGSESRSDRAVSLLADSPLLDRFGADHRVSVYRFDEQSEPTLISTSDRNSIDDSAQDSSAPQDEADAEPPNLMGSEEMTPTSSRMAAFGVACIGTGLALGLISLAAGAMGRSASVGWVILTSASCLFLGGVCLGSIYCLRSEQSLSDLLGMRRPANDERDDSSSADSAASATLPTVEPSISWKARLSATGSESRLGDAIRTALGDHEPSTLAGMVLVTDGQSNGGIDVGSAASLARRGGVSMYPVGMGSSDPPINARLVDLDAPKRIYPGDKFSVTAVLQASGPEPIEVELQLLDGLDDPDELDPEVSDGTTATGVKLPAKVIDSQKITLATDGSLTGARFELEPESVGRRRVGVRIIAPAADTNQLDNAGATRYEVVSRKLRVMAIAGGPTREYRFVRNLLFRDKSVELDVWLQTGQAGMSQDADRLLASFPHTADELFEYDAIMLFDPNWSAFAMEDLDLIDRWLSQQAGGLVMVAGPVYHPDWFRRRTDPRVGKTRGFFPVELATRGALLGGGRQGGENAWPLEMTPDARRAEFLWIAEQPAENLSVWNEFDGVYDFVGVKGLKAGAKAYARYSDPTTRLSGELPIYLASQFYGAGRTFFQSSGEMWRLREESDAHFDRYYTQLIRWVSEGRLLRDSTRGFLLVDNARAMMGDTIAIRAVLSDDQFEPLQVPEVVATLLTPGGQAIETKLLPLEGEPRPGTYGGRFVVREAGSYEVRLTLGNALDEEVLRQNVQVRLPTVELERPRRNDADLEQLATATAGAYIAWDEATGDDDLAASLSAMIKPQPQTTVLPGTPDPEFAERINVVLMWLLCMMLTFEWVTRRLHRLA
ncbi:MAG: VWA domain-containing protein [Planctomycetota bacterium]